MAIDIADLKPAPCPHCGFYHTTTCPRIKAIHYYQDGTIKKIELHAFEPVAIAGAVDLTKSIGMGEISK